MSTLHSLNCMHPITKFQEIPDLMEILINQILIPLGTPKVHKTIAPKGMLLEVDTSLDNKNIIGIMIISITGISRGVSSCMQFDERYNQRYSPPTYPPSPSLNSTFPEALSRSLLQIAENQSRTIDAMKVSHKAQDEAYREMTKANKMRDDDALFHSIGVYDGTNPTKFEKWIDSIDQATHITGRDLRKELMKKSDGIIRNTLSMMDNRWPDDDAIIAKLCQDFSSLSTMNRAREELKNLYQELGEPIMVFIYKYGQMHYLSTGIRANRETH